MESMHILLEDRQQLEQMPRWRQARALLTGEWGPLKPTDNLHFGSHERFGEEVARLAYIIYLSRTWAFAAGILSKGGNPRDALETWRNRVRSSIDAPGPLLFALNLFSRLGVDWDQTSLADRRFVRRWDLEMSSGVSSDDQFRADGLHWPDMQRPEIVSEALIGADLLGEWFRDLKHNQAPTDEDGVPMTRTVIDIRLPDTNNDDWIGTLPPETP